MKRLLMLVVMFSLFFALSSYALAGSVPAPKMVLTERRYDFKEVAEGSVVEHAFQVTNQGGGVLEIKNVNPG
jgi:hypothetical protein